MPYRSEAKYEHEMIARVTGELIVEVVLKWNSISNIIVVISGLTGDGRPWLPCTYNTLKEVLHQ